MKRARFILVVIVGVLLLPGSSASATDASLRQQIAPLNCTLQTIDNGTGVRYQVVPEACGVVIAPPTKKSNPTPPGPILPESVSLAPRQSSTVFNRSNVIDLTNLLTLAPSGESKPPIKVTARVGQVYQFAVTVPANAQQHQQEDSEQHSLIISNIDLSSPVGKTVTVTIHSKVFVRTIAEGQTVYEDLDSDGYPNIGITVGTITANKADLTMWQIAPKAAATIPAFPVREGIKLVEKQPYLFWYIATIIAMIMACIITIILIKKKYHRSRE